MLCFCCRVCLIFCFLALRKAFLRGWICFTLFSFSWCLLLIWVTVKFNTNNRWYWCLSSLEFREIWWTFLTWFLDDINTDVIKRTSMFLLWCSISLLHIVHVGTVQANLTEWWIGLLHVICSSSLLVQCCQRVRVSTWLKQQILKDALLVPNWQHG